MKSKWTRGKRTSTRKDQKRHQNGTQEPKIGPKKAVHGTPRGQKWSQEGAKRVQKRSQTASRTKKRTKTTPRPSWGSPKVEFGPLSPPPGRQLGGQIGIKTDPETIKNRSDNRREKNIEPRRSWARLGAILGRFGAPCGGKKPPKYWKT